MKKLEDYVRSIPDFPEPGIIFRDVTSILQDADGLHLAIDGLMDRDLFLAYQWLMRPENVLYRCAKRENCPVRQFQRNTIWNTEAQ